MNTKKLKKHYDRMFAESPVTANIYLFLQERADSKGVITVPSTNEGKEEFHRDFLLRFPDASAYQF